MTTRHLCGVMSDECRGALTETSRGMKQKIKMHATPQDAFKCKQDNLLKRGYIKVGQREFLEPTAATAFSTPNGVVYSQAVLVLTKKSKYGGKMTKGKSEKGIGKRHQPPNSKGGIRF